MNTTESEIPQMNLPGRTWQALKWNYFGNAVRSLSQFAIGILLARILGPEPFGVVAIAWMILGVGNLFADLGFGAALVQREIFSKRDLQFIFTWQMTFSACLTVAGILVAPLIALYFHRPDATPVIQTMFLLFVIQSLGLTASAVLRRSLDFKKLQQTMVISYLVGYLVVGVPAAYLGCGVWSLVAAQLLLYLLNSILLVRITKVPITLSFRGDSPGIVNFGMKITAANLSSWSISNLDTVFVGRAFGVVDLGLYSRAINLLSTPMNIITTGFQGVLLSACAQAQNNPGQIKRIFLETNAAVALLCFPIFVTTSIIPKTLVLGIYGSKWEASAAVITPLSLAVLVHALLAIEGPILTAMNRVGIELKNQIYTILLFIPILLMVVQYSLVTVAWAVFVIYMIRWILLTIATLRLTGATATEFLATLLVPVAIAAAIGTVAAVTDHYLFFLPAFYRLATVGCAAFITSLLSVRLFGAHFLRTNISSLVDVNNLSGTLRKFFNL